MRESVLRFSLGGNAWKAFAAGCGAGLCVWLAYEAYILPEDFYSSSRRATFFNLIGPKPTAAIMLTVGVYAFWLAGKSFWRFWLDRPALAIEGDALAMHPHFVRHPAEVPLAQLERVHFDRLDRIDIGGSGPLRFLSAFFGSTSSSVGVRLAAQCRYVLQIIYRGDDGSDRELCVMDNDVDGGTRALARFAYQLRRMKGWAGLGRTLR